MRFSAHSTTSRFRPCSNFSAIKITLGQSGTDIILPPSLAWSAHTTGRHCSNKEGCFLPRNHESWREKKSDKWNRAKSIFSPERESSSESKKAATINAVGLFRRRHIKRSAPIRKWFPFLLFLGRVGTVVNMYCTVRTYIKVGTCQRADFTSRKSEKSIYSLLE